MSRVVSGAGSRNRTSQFDTPTSAATYVAMAIPSSKSGAASRRGAETPGRADAVSGAPSAAVARRPLGIGTTAYAIASSDTTAPVPIATVCQARRSRRAAHRDRRRQGSDGERHVQQVHGPAPTLAIDVEDEAVRATVQVAGSGTGDERRRDEHGPGRRQPQARDARAMDQHGAAQDQPTTQAFGQRTPTERRRRVRQRIREVDDADPGIGLVEVSLIERMSDGTRSPVQPMARSVRHPTMPAASRPRAVMRAGRNRFRLRAHV